MTITRNLALAILLLASPLRDFAQGQEAQIQAITAALQANELSRAVELTRTALKEFPSNAQLWAMQGAAYSGQGQNKQALDSFRAALKISPYYLPALHGAIQIEYEGGNKDAIPLLQRVLRARPADQISHGMLAVLEYQQGNAAAAVIHFEKARALFERLPN